MKLLRPRAGPKNADGASFNKIVSSDKSVFSKIGSSMMSSLMPNSAQELSKQLKSCEPPAGPLTPISQKQTEASPSPTRRGSSESEPSPSLTRRRSSLVLLKTAPVEQPLEMNSDEHPMLGVWKYTMREEDVFFEIVDDNGILMFSGGLESNMVSGEVKFASRFYTVQLTGALGHSGKEYGTVRLLMRGEKIILNFKEPGARTYGEDVVASKTVVHGGRRWSWGPRALDSLDEFSGCGMNLSPQSGRRRSAHSAFSC